MSPQQPAFKVTDNGRDLKQSIWTTRVDRLGVLLHPPRKERVDQDDESNEHLEHMQPVAMVMYLA